MLTISFTVGFAASGFTILFAVIDFSEVEMFITSLEMYYIFINAP
jgi:hypothetical protein